MAVKALGFFHQPSISVVGLPTEGNWYSTFPRRYARRRLSSGHELEIGTAGFFGIQFPAGPNGGPSTQAEELQFASAVLCAFHSALFRKDRISIPWAVPSFLDVFSLYSLEQGPAAFGSQRGGHYATLQITGSKSSLDHILLDPIAEVEFTTVEYAFDIMEQLVAHPTTGAVTHAALYLRSEAARAEHDYSLALILAWASIEGLVYELWGEFVCDSVGLDNPDAKRRKTRLSDSRTYSTSVVIEILRERGVLAPHVYVDLNDARGARNAWIHERRPSSPEVVVSALRGLQALHKARNLPLGLNHGAVKEIF